MSLTTATPYAGSDPATPPVTNTNQIRSITMNTMNEDLARAHMSARLGEAQELRMGSQMARARRLSRRAERAAQQARLALARAL